MGREEECVCCHEIEQVGKKNQEVMEYTKPTLSYDCITDNPGLDGWVLQSAWSSSMSADLPLVQIDSLELRHLVRYSHEIHLNSHLKN